MLRRDWGTYLLAIAVSTAAVGLRVLLDSWLGGHPVLTAFLLPVIISAYLGGLGPGLAAVTIVTLGTEYFVLEPVYSMEIAGTGDLLGWVAMIACGVVICVSMDLLRRARQSDPTPPVASIASTELKMRVGFAAALLVFIAVGSLSYHSILQSSENAAARQRAEQSIDAMNLLLIGLRDLETDVGRFVITGAEGQLKSYRATIAQIETQLEAVRLSLLGSPVQLKRFEALAQLVAKREAVANDLIELRRLGFEPARAAIAGGEARRLLDSIRGTVNEMSQTENAVSRERQSRVARYSTLTLAGILLGGALTFAFVFAALFLIGRDFAGRRRADAALAEAHGLLEARVRERTEQLSRSNELLLASEMQMRLLTDAMPALIAHIDSQHRYKYVNQTYANWWGRSRDDIIGKPVREILGPENCAEIASQLDAALAGRTVSFERTILRPDGERRCMRGTFVPDSSGGSKTSGIFVLVNDVTDQRRAETLVQRAEKMEALGTLAGGIAHDFNNILPAIIGFSDMAANDVPRDHPVQDKLARIKASAQRASDLVGRILAFSRPPEHAAGSVDLATTIEEALKLMRSTLPAMIDVKADLAPGLAPVVADPTQVFQIVVNLLTNASHAIGSTNGVIELRLEPLSVEQEINFLLTGLAAGRYARLTVSDTGCGMDAETQLRIFDPFFTTKPVGQGTGLGLSIIHGIMKSLGGAITVYSEPGKGTKFHLYFPLAHAAANVEPREPAKEAVRGDGQRLLYLDDEESLVYLADFELTRLGYVVTGMTSAKEALAAFRERPMEFDMVITDLSMPGASGFEFAQAVLAIRPDLPVVVTSGYVRPEDEARARSLGVRELIYKPTSVLKYAQVLDAAFRHRRDPLPGAESAAVSAEPAQ